MNPLLLLIVVLILSGGDKRHGSMTGLGQGRRFPAPPPLPRFDYFDTFHMELLLDRMRTLTEALEKVNHLRQIDKLPPTRESSLNKIQDSVDAARGFLADTKAGDRLENVSRTLSGAKQLGDAGNLLSSVAPLLSLLSSSANNTEEKDRI